VTIETGHGSLEVNIRRNAFVDRAEVFSAGAAAVADGAGVLHGRSAEKLVTGDESAPDCLRYVDVAVAAARMAGVAIVFPHRFEPGEVHRARSHFQRFILTGQGEVDAGGVKLDYVGVTSGTDQLGIFHIHMGQGRIGLGGVSAVAVRTAQRSMKGFGEALFDIGVEKGLAGRCGCAASSVIGVSRVNDLHEPHELARIRVTLKAALVSRWNVLRNE
jgi:hypothetical protein